MSKSSAHFSEEELKCSHCGEVHMDSDFLERLERVRVEYDAPMVVTSGYRCPEYNNIVSSTGFKGPHTQGRAVDIGVYGGDAHRLVTIALKHGMSGVGVKQSGSYEKRFIHLDDTSGPTRPWIWTY